MADAVAVSVTVADVEPAGITDGDAAAVTPLLPCENAIVTGSLNPAMRVTFTWNVVAAPCATVTDATAVDTTKPGVGADDSVAARVTPL